MTASAVIPYFFAFVCILTDSFRLHAVKRETIFQIRRPKVTHAAKKGSDKGVEIVKGHYCGRGSKATEGGGWKKVTHAAKN